MIKVKLFQKRQIEKLGTIQLLILISKDSASVRTTAFGAILKSKDDSLKDNKDSSKRRVALTVNALQKLKFLTRYSIHMVHMKTCQQKNNAANDVCFNQANFLNDTVQRNDTIDILNRS